MITVTMVGPAKDWRRWASRLLSIWTAELSADSITMWENELAEAKTDQQLAQVCKDMLDAWNPFYLLSIG